MSSLFLRDITYTGATTYTKNLAVYDLYNYMITDKPTNWELTDSSLPTPSGVAYQTFWITFTINACYKVKFTITTSASTDYQRLYFYTLGDVEIGWVADSQTIVYYNSSTVRCKFKVDMYNSIGVYDVYVYGVSDGTLKSWANMELQGKASPALPDTFLYTYTGFFDISGASYYLEILGANSNNGYYAIHYPVCENTSGEYCGYFSGIMGVSGGGLSMASHIVNGTDYYYAFSSNLMVPV